MTCSSLILGLPATWFKGVGKVEPRRGQVRRLAIHNLHTVAQIKSVAFNWAPLVYSFNNVSIICTMADCLRPYERDPVSIGCERWRKSFDSAYTRNRRLHPSYILILSICFLSTYKDR